MSLTIHFPTVHTDSHRSPFFGLFVCFLYTYFFKKVKAKEKEVRILILGLDNAGKTTILRKFSGESIDTIEPTLGFNIKTLAHGGYNLNLWDVGGQKSIRAYWRNYFESTDGLIWVVDTNDRTRLDLCKKELFSLLQEEKLTGASLLIFANKQDVEGEYIMHLRVYAVLSKSNALFPPPPEEQALFDFYFA